MKVALFCGGRGSQALIRELLRWRDIDLTLLVNAYDDGLSTGALRALIPGMLGPSDFRKNLSYLLGLYSAPQHALQNLIEYRFPIGFGDQGEATLEAYARDGDESGFPEAFRQIYADIEPQKKNEIRSYIRTFIEYYRNKGSPAFDFGDCSFGNLIFAGIYLTVGESFNGATAAFGRLVSSEAHLVNVSQGENRTLTALKEDGQILSRESQVVGSQSDVPIGDIFFTDGPISQNDLQALDGRSLAEKRAWLDRSALHINLSEEARIAIENADVILYGPGTQHSSLYPSYIMASEAVARSKARVKAFVSNLHFDHDIQGYTVNKLIQRALYYLRDSGNARGMITHVLYADQPSQRPDSVLVDTQTLRPDGTIEGAILVRGPFQNPNKPGFHSGNGIVKQVRELARRNGPSGAERGVQVFIDLYKRSILVDALIDEFLEIDWGSTERQVAVAINRAPVPQIKAVLPDHVTLSAVNLEATEPETQMLLEWLNSGTSEFLVTITGDGEYRLRDVLPSLTVLNNSTFGVLFGSRAQSRQQLRRSLQDAYGDSALVRGLSRFGAASVSALFFLRHGSIFSDPMTGFRVYQRSKLPLAFRATLQERGEPAPTTTRITNLLLRHGVEIGELPITYRTFRSFTDFRWRLRRGFRNLAGLIS